MTTVEHLLAVQNKLGEGPLWHPDERRFYWVDIDNHCFHRYDPTGDDVETFTVGLPVGTLAFREQGGLILATRDGFAFWDEASGRLDFIVDPEADKPDCRFNDGAVDPGGRFWAGTMGRENTSKLYRLDPDRSLHVMETGIHTSNGLGWSPDRRTMYYVDTPTQLIWAYDYDLDSGAISNRRTLVDTQDEPGYPDGLTVDSEGFIWSARWDGWRISRYDPAGRRERIVELPVQRPTSCTFGGPDLSQLYITSAAADQAQAGDIFRLQTEVTGMPEPTFKG